MKKSFRQIPTCLFHETIVAFMGHRGKRRRLCVFYETQMPEKRAQANQLKREKEKRGRVKRINPQKVKNTKQCS